MKKIAGLLVLSWMLASVAWAGESVDGRYSGSWYDPDRSGEGWVLQILEDDQAFMAWFTYPPAGLDQAQTWMVGTGRVVGNRVEFDNLQQFSGPRFGVLYDPFFLTPSDWGTLTMEFSDCESGTLEYAGPAEYGSAMRSITRLSSVDGLGCDDALKGASPQGISASFYDPTHNGEGWFFEELGDGRVNMYWFTYNGRGQPAWLTGVGQRLGNSLVIDPVYRVDGPVFGAAFSSADVALQNWGAIQIRVLECDQLTLDYQSIAQGFGVGSLNPERLTSLQGLPCDRVTEPLIAGRWRRAAPMAVANSGGGMVLLDGLAYMTGGFAAPKSVQVYDIETDSWTRLADMPVGRNRHLSVAHNGEVYVFGGYGDASTTLIRSAYAYNPQTQVWRRLADMPGTLAAAGQAVELAGEIYMAGGDTELTPIRYNPQSDSYTFFPAPDGPTDHSQAIGYRGELWVIGGREPFVDETNRVRIFDPSNETWRDGPPMLRKRASFAVATLKGQLMVVGGDVVANPSTQPTTLNLLEVYVPSLDAWVDGPSMPDFAHGLSAVSINGQLVVAGGASNVNSSFPNGNTLIYDPEPPSR
jgi:hypothetical protein